MFNAINNEMLDCVAVLGVASCYQMNNSVLVYNRTIFPWHVCSVATTHFLSEVLKLQSKFCCTITVTSHERHGASSHRILKWLFNSLFSQTTKKTSNLHITGSLWGTPVTDGFLSQKPVARSATSSYFRTIMMIPDRVSAVYNILFTLKIFQITNWPMITYGYKLKEYSEISLSLVVFAHTALETHHKPKVTFLFWPVTRRTPNIHVKGVKYQCFEYACIHLIIS